ncbi:N-acetylmuramoyl-L-alanine amidase [Streptomyces sp. NRRL S-455]|uniref:peptidoglycan recognition protein family protein n=1 Tax=Streptomyces sp. NRRL S-455 TaxID=1463908 RepID=UPI00068EF39E|nr:N-acetylmuramoyl-L-alanine amidase [Streptomyces sp. NRRL S-455]
MRVSEYPGWRTRERDDETGLAFGPVRMILNHHTAGRNSRDVVARDGVPGLPPPLAHIHLAKDGTATMCSAGRANHAGPMAINAYQSFRDEASVHPAPSRASGTIDGNDVSYGIETENLGDGEDVYPRAQYDAWVRTNAAICRHYGWSAESVACHKETSVEGKPDPRGPVAGYGSRGRFEFTPKQFRADVAERLRHDRTWSPGEEEDMALTNTEIGKIADAVVAKLLAGGGVLEGSDVRKIFTTDDVLTAPSDAADYATNKHWTFATHVQSTTTAVREIRAQARSNGEQLTALKRAVDAIKAKVGA